MLVKKLCIGIVQDDSFIVEHFNTFFNEVFNDKRITLYTLQYHKHIILSQYNYNTKNYSFELQIKIHQSSA